MVLSNYTSPQMAVSTAISQGSTLSLILFLFFIGTLLLLSHKHKVTAGGFVDDTNILTWPNSTDASCRTLEQTHRICEDWSSKHGAKFALHKHSLIHFSRARRKHDMQACIQIQGHETKPSPSIRLLGLWLDPKLSWGPHVQRIQLQARQNIEPLSRLTKSTWGATFAQARHLYSAIIRLVLTFVSQVWAMSKKRNGLIKKTLIEPLERVQTECLRKITGAYKSTDHRALEHETETLPMGIYRE